LDLGFKISTDLVKKNISKYTSEFSVRNSYTGPKNSLPGFIIRRKYHQKDQKEALPSLEIAFTPKLKGEENFFYFEISSLNLQHSKAKIKGDYNLLDYTIEIKLGYFEGKEKKYITSSPIKV